jgi:hypothetical protein
MLAPALGLVLLAGCKNSSSPSSQSIDNFATGMTSSDGGVTASESRGSAPAASGGPAAIVTTSGTSSSATVINGGSSLVHVRASAPFNQVFMSVIDDPLDGFFTLTLPAATTDTFVVIQFGRTIPVNTFQTVFSVKTPGGQVGASSSIANTVSSGATGQVQVQASWDANSDVDLHVIEPSGYELDFINLGTASPTGGLQDVDSICGDHGNIENTRWTTGAPNGTYTVRLDYYSSCGVSASNYVVTVNNGSQTSRFTGQFTGNGDSGGHGSGRLITTFTHSASSLTTQEAPSTPSAPEPLSPAVLAKRARALAGGR